jgi:hypothetical protein
MGITGHQRLPAATATLVRDALGKQLADVEGLAGVAALAEGADQLFALEVIRHGGQLTAVIPSARYRETFTDAPARQRYDELLRLASEVITLPFAQPTEDAFMAAGREVVDRCDTLMAVWDGRPAAGLGGTADVVAYAIQQSKPVIRVWPSGASRSSLQRREDDR